MRAAFPILLTIVTLSLPCSSQELRKATSGASYGIGLFKEFADKGKTILYYDFGASKAPNGGFLKLVTIEKKSFQEMPTWDGTTPLPTPVEKLVKIGFEAVSRDYHFEEINILPSHADPKRKLAVIRYSASSRNGIDEQTVFLSLNGIVLNLESRTINDEDVVALMEHGIPRS